MSNDNTIAVKYKDINDSYNYWFRKENINAINMLISNHDTMKIQHDFQVYRYKYSVWIDDVKGDHLIDIYLEEEK